MTMTHLSLRPLSSLDSPGLPSSLLSSRSSSLDVLTTRDSIGISKLAMIQLILRYKISCIIVSFETGRFTGHTPTTPNKADFVGKNQLLVVVGT